jgi:alkylhydroperoxidase family enzyme
LIADWRLAELNTADKAMLTYVEKLTLRPWEMVEADVIALRTAGFSDAAILDINQVTGYYAFVNRLADGLGVELEYFWETVEQLNNDSAAHGYQNSEEETNTNQAEE